MRLGLARQRQELSVDYRENADPRDARFFECPTTATLDGSGVVRNRYAFAETPEIVWVRPALADRAVVVYPEEPFHVTAGESITLFCSTPLWIRVEIGASRHALMETAIERPPDTWIGPSTREGELCYATQTAARLDGASGYGDGGAVPLIPLVLVLLNSTRGLAESSGRGRPLSHPGG